MPPQFSGFPEKNFRTPNAKRDLGNSRVLRNNFGCTPAVGAQKAALLNTTGEEETVSGAPQISGTLWGAPTFGNAPQTAPELVGEEERVGARPKRASSRKGLCGYPP